MITQQKLSVRFISLTMFLCGLVGVMLTGSRGSMLALLVLISMSVFLQFGYGKRNILIVSISVLSITVFIALIDPLFIERFILAYHQIESWFSGEKLISSPGERLEFIRAGFLAFLDSPWIGFGMNESHSIINEYSRIKFPLQYNHFHNEVINHLVSAGIVGVVVMVAILYAPFHLFKKNLEAKENRLTALIGLNLVTGFFLFGLTHVTFQQEVINSVWMFYSVYLISIIKRERKDQ